jgi:uncharacterized protein YuzE
MKKMTDTTFSLTVELDLDANTGYIGLSGNDVVRTRQLNDEVLVDLDEFGMVVGIEFLRLDAEIPFTRLIEECHVHSDVVERIRALRPSLAVRFSFGTDGTATLGAKNLQMVSSGV